MAAPSGRDGRAVTLAGPASPLLSGPAPIRRRTLLAGLPALAATAWRPASAASSDAPVLRVVAPWEFDSADPVETGYILTRIGVGETLVGVRPDGRLVGLLAESWAVDPDHLTWRFHLRAARFHDGTPVLAAHVADTLARVRPQAESLSAIPLAAIHAEDDRTLVIRTATPFAPLPGYLTDYAGVILAPSAYDAAGRAQHPVATGPYRVTAVDGARGIEAEAFPGYWGDKPAIPRIRYIAAPSGEARASMVEAGDADLAFTLLPQAAQRIVSGGQFHVASAVIPRARMLVMNLGHPPFAELAVRRAISLAIDRAGIAAAVLRNPPSAATQLLPPVLAGWYDPALPPLQHDAAQARRLLAQAGWAAGPDGVLARDGARLAATMLVPANRPELPVMGQAIQAQLREVGIALEVRPGPFNAIPGAIRDGSLQMGLLARTYVNVPDPIGTIIPDFTGDHPVWASPGFDDAELRRLAAEYVASFDAAALPALRRRIVAILQEQLPVIPVSWFESNVALSARLDPASVVLDPYEMSYGLQAARWAA